MSLVVLGGGAGIGQAQQQPTAFDVKGFGAAADGVTNDAPAIDKAIEAASHSKTGTGVVEFAAGTYLAAGTVHLKSGVTIHLDKGSTITGSSSGYDKAEDNKWDKYQ